ncbi:hypothetical protein CFC21_014917 [Triticum aestivum]|uniref:Uncharacterized protein n=2 Tax=Triticum aestivum TaxID=4565 RepID=A0A9R1DW44_WHEAT|nr:hypothetical protein CFC21_014917 [Triticum aestivum]
MKSTSVFGANILWQMINKRLVLSKLRMKDAKTLPYENLKRFVKLDNRVWVTKNNTLTAKN